MVGGGVEVDALRALADELAPGKVEFATPQPPEVLSKGFSAAPAALASIRPGVGYDFAFATKALAGLSAGAPVIYAGVGPLAQVVAAHGLGWAVGWDEREVARAMAAALDAPPTPATRAAAAEWVLENHSLRAVATKAVAVVESVVAPH